MKIILTVLLSLMGISMSHASLPTMDKEGKDIVFETPVMNWVFSPDKACYFQAHKLSECWMYGSQYDLGVCIECILAGQADPNQPSCDSMNSSAIEECAKEHCDYSSCNEKAMDLFNCVVDDACSDSSSGKGTTGQDSDVCEEEAYDFRTCLDTTEYDVDTCTECIFAGQLDPDGFSCKYVDCGAIGDCQDTYCDACDDEFYGWTNCALEEVCSLRCTLPGDACYDEVIAANSCPASLPDVNACISCYYAGQSDPHNPTCDEIDCNEYLKCLNEKCANCVHEYMTSFACSDKEAQCNVVCSNYRKLVKGRSNPRPLHHFRALARRRKGPRVNGPRPKSH